MCTWKRWWIPVVRQGVPLYNIVTATHLRHLTLPLNDCSFTEICKVNFDELYLKHEKHKYLKKVSLPSVYFKGDMKLLEPHKNWSVRFINRQLQIVAHETELLILFNFLKDKFTIQKVHKTICSNHEKFRLQIYFWDFP